MKDWYGIKGIKFIYRGDYSDPLLEYRGILFNEHDVADILWDEYNEKCGERHIPATLKGFARHLRRHREEVFERADDTVDWVLSVQEEERRKNENTKKNHIEQQ